jgi:hypothetical protein
LGLVQLSDQQLPPGFTAEILRSIEDAFGEYLTLPELRDVIEAALAAAYSSAFEGATSADVLRAAIDHGAALVTRVSEQIKLQIAEAIATGLEQGLGHVGTARLIRDKIGLDSNREKSLENFRADREAAGYTGDKLEAAVAREKVHLINDRAKTIAHNEMAVAFEAASRQQAIEGGSTHKYNIQVPDGDVDECDDCTAQGVIPIDEPFVTGDMEPPFHPNCRCTIGYASSTDEASLGWAQDNSTRVQSDVEQAALATQGDES